MEPTPKHRELLPNKLGHPRFPNKLGHPVGHPRFPNKLGHPVGHPVMKGRRASLPKDWRVFEKALLRACDAGR